MDAATEAGAGDAEAEGESDDARRALDGERARCTSATNATALRPREADGFVGDGKGYLSPQIPAAIAHRTKLKGLVRAPQRIGDALELKDEVSKATLGITIADAVASTATIADGYVVHRDAFGSAAHLFRRASADGFEDFIALPRAPTTPSIAYDVELRAGIAGLRLVSNTLEFLDEKGNPRLRVSPPQIQSADCSMVAAKLEVTGCAFDTVAGVPWGRPVTAPGATRCRVAVTWDPAEVTFPALLDPPWTTPGSMASPRSGFTLTPYSNGAFVLAAGGYGSPFFLNTAEVLNVGTGAWTAIANMNAPRSAHTATLLSSGKILLAGGGSTPTADVFDPGNPTTPFAAAGSMMAARSGHSASLLADGTVWIAGGTVSGAAVASVESYSPTTNTFSTKTAMAHARAGHFAAPLSGGQILVVAGDSTAQLCEILTPSGSSGQGSWASTFSLPTPRTNFAGAILSNGDVLIAGGLASSVASNATSLYGATSRAWSAKATLTTARAYATAVTLPGASAPTGSILVAGGRDASNAFLQSAEVYTDAPAPTGTWTPHAAMLGVRANHSVAQPHPGYMLEAGGLSGVGVSVNTTELMDPCDGVPIDDGTTCTTDLCDDNVSGNGTGAITHPVTSPVGAYCNGSDFCTPSTCLASGTCQAGTPPVISDGNACTDDACIPSLGVTHTPSSTSTFCTDGQTCNSSCDGNGSCTKVNLDDGNACSVDECVGGVRKNTRAASLGTNASDGNPCNGVEYCDGSTTTPHAGTHPDTSWTDGCSKITCDIVLGLQVVPVASPPSYCSASNNPPGSGGDPTLGTDPGTGNTFIYGDGGAGYQVGNDAAALIAGQKGVLRGRVLISGDGVDAGPLGVATTVSILNHPEYGVALSRPDGWFDMVVNGGTTLTINYATPGYLPIQRTVATRADDYTVAPDVVVTAPNPTTTPVTLPFSGVVVAEGATNKDNEGPRTARVFIPGNATISGTLPDGGAWSPSGTVNIQATEYTVDSDAGAGPLGKLGPLKMPGSLPPTSGYTYAAELGIVQAPAGVSPQFTVPAGYAVAYYVENFINIPLGQSAPVGYYDAKLGAWVAAKSGAANAGLVIKYVGVDSMTGLANLDVNGDGFSTAADVALYCGPALQGPNCPGGGLAISDWERAAIVAKLTVGSSYWRVQLSHFSSWDTNWGFGPPSSPPPPGPPPTPPPPPQPPTCPSKAKGSIIECEGQILAEEEPIAGTPFSLRYQSEKTAGRMPQLSIPISDGRAISPLLKRVDVTIEVAGHSETIRTSAPIYPYQDVKWTWDRKDAYGRTVQGSATATVTVGYVYASVALATTALARYGDLGFTSPSGDRLAREFSYQNTYRVPVGSFDVKPLGFGGWAFSAQHVLDTGVGMLLYGDGRRRSTPPPTIASLASLATLSPSKIAVGPTGLIYISDVNPSTPHVWLFNPVTSALTVFAGSGTKDYLGDGGQATGAAIDFGPGGTDLGPVAVGPRGEVYLGQVTTVSGAVSPGGVRKIDPTTGIITTVAGGKGVTGGTDGGPATQFGIGSPAALAVAADGSLFIGSYLSGTSGPTVVYRVGRDGNIQKIAGNGTSSDTGTPPCSAAKIGLTARLNLTIAPNGDLLIHDGSQRIGRVTSDGTWTNVTTALMQMGAIASSRDGTIFVPSSGPTGGMTAVYSVDPANQIRRFAGSTFSNVLVPASGGPAIQSTFGNISGLAFAPDGSLVMVDGTDKSLYRVSAAVTQRIVDDEGAAHNFVGRHLSTQMSERGKTTYSMIYGLAARPATCTAIHSGADVSLDTQLTAVTDQDQNSTCIFRPDALTVKIVAPHGDYASGRLTTALALDTHGYISTLTPPNAAEAISMTHSPTGLLTQLVTPVNQLHTFGYSSEGRLISDVAPINGGATTLLSSLVSGSASTVSFTTPAGLKRTYLRDFAAATTDRAETQTVTRPDGAIASFAVDKDDTVVVALPDSTSNCASTPTGPPVGCVATRTTYSADSRFGSGSRFVSAVSTTYPSASSIPYSSSWAQTRAFTLSGVGDGFTNLSTETRTTTVSGQATSGSTPVTYSYTNIFDATAGTWTTTTPVGRKVITTVDPTDRPTQIKIPGGNGTNILPIDPVNFVYETVAPFRVLQVTQGAASNTRTTTTTFNPTTGFVDAVATPFGSTTYTRDPLSGRVSSMLLPSSRTVGFTYDLRGNKATTTPPGETAHTTGYNGVDLLSSYVPPDAGFPNNQTTYAYDNDRKFTSLLAPNATITYGYDPFGRFEVMTDPTGDQVTYGFDAAGRTTSAQTSAGVRRDYTYAGPFVTQVKSTLPPWGTSSMVRQHAVNYTYDVFERVSSVTVDSGTPMNYGYTELKSGGGTADDGLLTSVGPLIIARDPANGLISTTTFSITTAGVTHSVTEVYSYNTFGEVTDITSKVDGVIKFEEALTRDYASNFSGSTNTGRVRIKMDTVQGTSSTWNYSYDPSNRLYQANIGTTTRTYTYDGNGNRQDGTTPAAVYDAQDRMTSHAGTPYVYTTNGELSSKGSIRGHNIKIYGYDLRGNLRSISSPFATSYVIDPDGRRVGLQPSPGSMTQAFVYGGGDRPVAELDVATGNVKSTFVYGMHQYTPDFMIQGTTYYRIVSDYLGSPRLVIDMSSGTVKEQLDYDEWGNETDTITPGFQPFGFTGGIYDGATGFVRLGARDYDPSVGRWTSKDATRFSGGLNFYVYAENNPINLVDFDGRHPSANPFGGGNIFQLLYQIFFGAYRRGEPPPWEPPNEGRAWRNCLSKAPGEDRDACCDTVCETYHDMHPDFDEAACKEGCKKRPRKLWDDVSCPMGWFPSLPPIPIYGIP